MSKDKALNVVISRNHDGWYTATSEDMPGLYVAHEDLGTVLGELPAVVRALIKADPKVGVDFCKIICEIPLV